MHIRYNTKRVLFKSHPFDYLESNNELIIMPIII